MAGEQTPQEMLESLLHTIRYDVKFESDRMGDANFPAFYRIRERAGADENTTPLAAFLNVPVDQTGQIATADLFED